MIESLEKNADIEISEIEEQVNESLNFLPCQIQLNRLKEQNKVRGGDNKFFHHKLQEEIETIYAKQMELNSFTLSDSFMQKYFNIFNRKREFYQGPGKQSPFSWNGDEEEFYNRLIGYDTYDKNEVRASKFGIYANLLNLLNDLNNLKVTQENGIQRSLSLEEKELIIAKVFDFVSGWKGKIVLKQLLSFLGIQEDAISGFREDKDKKAEFNKFEALIMIFNKLKKKETKFVSWINLNNISFLDEVITTLTKSQSLEGSQQKLKSLFALNQDIFKDILEQEEIESMVQELAILYTKIKGSH